MICIEDKIEKHISEVIWNGFAVIIQNRLSSYSFLVLGLIIVIVSCIMTCLLFVNLLWVMISVFCKMEIALCIMHMLSCDKIVSSFIMTFLFCIGQVISNFCMFYCVLSLSYFEILVTCSLCNYVLPVLILEGEVTHSVIFVMRHSLL